MEIPVAVIASDAAVRRALLAQVREWPGLREAADGETGSVIIATPRDCSPQKCRELTAAGNRVVILTPIWREYERSNYQLAGACDYLPMDFDLPRLAQAVTEGAATIRRAGPELNPVTPFQQ